MLQRFLRCLVKNRIASANNFHSWNNNFEACTQASITNIKQQKGKNKAKKKNKTLNFSQMFR